MRKTKILIIFLALVLLFTATSCNEKEIANKRGEMLFYKAKELTAGFYIKNPDETFTPVMSGASGYQGAALEANPTRYLWYSHTPYNLTQLIPKLTVESELVAVFDKTKYLPTTITLEKYKKVGMTIGVKLYISDIDGTIYFKTTQGDYCPKSQIGNALAGSGLPGEITLYEFNGSPAIPKGAIDKNLNMLMGLEENKTYQMGFFEGTYYQSKAVDADTYVYQSQELYLLQKPYLMLKDGYFVIKMPLGSSKGFYYINDYGLFYYDK